MNEPLDYSGHQPEVDLDQYGRDADHRINKSLPVDLTSQEARAFGLRASDFQQPNPADMPPVRVARDRAVYTREQKGHSFLLHWVVLGVFTCFIVPVYYSFSPRHYWHI